MSAAAQAAELDHRRLEEEAAAAAQRAAEEATAAIEAKRVAEEQAAAAAAATAAAEDANSPQYGDDGAWHEGPPGVAPRSAAAAPQVSAAELAARRAATRQAEARRRQAALDALRKVKEREASGANTSPALGQAGYRQTVGEQLAAEDMGGPSGGVLKPQGQGRTWRGAPSG